MSPAATTNWRLTQPRVQSTVSFSRRSGSFSGKCVGRVVSATRRRKPHREDISAPELVTRGNGLTCASRGTGGVPRTRAGLSGHGGRLCILAAGGLSPGGGCRSRRLPRRFPRTRLVAATRGFRALAADGGGQALRPHPPPSSPHRGFGNGRRALGRRQPVAPRRDRAGRSRRTRRSRHCVAARKRTRRRDAVLHRRAIGPAGGRVPRRPAHDRQEASRIAFARVR